MNRNGLPNSKQQSFVPVDGTELTLPVTVVSGGAPG